MIPNVDVYRTTTLIKCPICNGIVKPDIIREIMLYIESPAEIELKCSHCKRQIRIVCRK